jgi:ankyrin repeat protein
MPHYVRCLKPNDSLEPDNFDPSNIVEQLRYCGVLEAVRVSRAGYPTRYPHEVFMTRYYIICPNRATDIDNLSPYHSELSTHLTEEQKQLKRLVSRTATEIWKVELEIMKRSGSKPKPQDNRNALAQPKDLDEFMRLDFSSRCAVAGLQLGQTKVFLRREAFECIESMRNEKFGTNVTKISKNWRCLAAKVNLKRARHAAILIQCLARMKMANTKTEQLMRDFRLYLRMKVAATKVQRCYRCFHIVTYEEGADLRKAKSSVLKIQGCMRGCIARRQVLNLLRCICKLQSLVRMTRVREDYVDKRNAIIKMQSIARMPPARRKLDEARKQRSALKLQSIVRMKYAFTVFRTKIAAASRIKQMYRKHLYQEHAMCGTFLKRYYMLGDPKDFTSKSSLKKKKIMLARHRNAIIIAKRLELTKLVNKMTLDLWEPGLFESFVKPGFAESARHLPQASLTNGKTCRPAPAPFSEFTPIPQSIEEFMTRETPSKYALVGMQMCHGTIFMRSETHALLEKRRNDMVGGSSAKIQSVARRKLAVNALKRMRFAVVKIQSYFRMQSQRKELDPKRRERAATNIQSAFRMSTTRKRVWTTYWSTQSRELFAFIGDDNWYMVEKMLHKNPLLVEEADPNTGELPLHKIVERASAWTLLIDMVLTLYPKAVVHKDLSGSLPIHHAAHADNLIGLEIIYKSYKNGAKDADASGRFPIHVAAERGSIEAIKFLTMKVPESVHIVTSGGVSLPLHLACKNYSSVGAITSLLRSPLRFSLASRVDEFGELPLHLLLRCGAEVDVVAVKSLLTCHLKAIGARDKSGDIPLHIALKHKCKPAVIESLLAHFPGSSVVLDGDSHSPLYLALSHAAEDETSVLLISYAPQVSTSATDFGTLVLTDIFLSSRVFVFLDGNSSR